jgi:hypothetical protein
MAGMAILSEFALSPMQVALGGSIVLLAVAVAVLIAMRGK